MKNIAVFCKNILQVLSYAEDIHGKGFDHVSDHKLSFDNVTYHCLTKSLNVDKIRGIRWDAVIHLADYQECPHLIYQVNMNLLNAPKKSKRELLIEELEIKLAELKKEEGL